MKMASALLALVLANCTFGSDVSIGRGRELLKCGSYKEAAAVFAALLEKDPLDRQAALGLFRARLETGDYTGAEQVIKKSLDLHPGAPELVVALGQVLFETGRYGEAASYLERAEPSAEGTLRISARIWRARALVAQGREAQAQAILREIIYSHGTVQNGSAEFLALMARALALLERFREANEFYIDARQADPSFLDAYIGQGELLLEKYNYAEAASLFRDALRINPNSAAALVGLAESKRIESSHEALAEVNRALSINPNHVRALALRAWLELEADDSAAALKSAERALQINPNSVDAMAVRAAAFYVEDRRGELEAEINRALSVNPRAGALMETLMHFAVIKRRYAEAVEFGRRALELSPRLHRARAQLGIQLLRLGRMVEGRAELERAFADDPFNVWAKNTLDLLDSMREYREVVRGPFLIKSAPKDSDVISDYAADLLEEARSKLSAKYRFTPRAPIMVELFPNHEDFAVRSLGLPGLGALGACFGQVIAMDSPSAREPGRFNWGGTLWHEFAHVVTLQLSNYRVPRWLTEGLSVYEERRARPGWGDNWSLERIKAYLGGHFVSIGELEAAFTRPRSPDQIPLAYFQASLVCEFIEEKFGFDTLLQMLSLYSEGLSTSEVFKRALRMVIGEFDGAFNQYVRSKIAPYMEALGDLDPNRPDSKGALLALIEAKPRDYFAHLKLGSIYKSEGDAERAREHLERAIELFPFKVDPYLQLADIYESLGRKAEAAAKLEAAARIDETGLEVLKRLAKLRLELGDRAGALEALRSSFYIYPFEASLHGLAGRLYLEQGRPLEAIREYRVALACEPADLAAAHYDLARALLQAGRASEARRELLRSLEIAPGFEPAQELLLKLRENR
jgi:tetratricopeptide (TPR) repeat protein